MQRDGRAGARPCAPVQLGPEHGARCSAGSIAQRSPPRGRAGQRSRGHAPERWSRPEQALPNAAASMAGAAVDAPYANPEQLEPGVARLLARNPSPFTYFGTQTYLVGDEELAVIDPGPDLPEHVEAIVAALDGRHAGRDRLHPHPPRPSARPAAPLAGSDRRADHRLRAAGAGKHRPARRRQLRQATMRRTGCWPTARRSSSTTASG